MALFFYLFFFLLLARLSNASFNCEDASWGPWRCPGRNDVCSSPNAFRFKCLFGDCTESSPCANLRGNREETSCATALTAHLCKPWFTQWMAWSPCSATCGVQERVRRRSCAGAYTALSRSNSCMDPTHVAQMRKRKRSLGEESDACFVRRLCPRIDGHWGQWGHFSPCSVTCGIGKRTRIRRCNDPSPKSGGLPCSGINSMQTECRSNTPCPQDGTWCPWTADPICSRSCGGGVGVRTRTCECPRAKYGGKDCRGESRDLFQCATEMCPYKKGLSAKERLIWLNFLYSSNQEIMWELSTEEVASEGDVMNLMCSEKSPPRQLVFDVENRFPKRRYVWFFGEETLMDSRERIALDDFLLIRRLTTKDIGFYSLMVERDPSLFTPLCFFFVYLQKQSAVARFGETFVLEGNLYGSDAVTQIDTHLWHMQWEFEPDKMARSFGSQYLIFWRTERSMTDFKLVSRRTIVEVSLAMSGTYHCVVVRKATPNTTYAKFVTAEIRLYVEFPPTFWQEILRILRERIPTIIAAFSTVIVISATYFVWLSIKKRYTIKVSTL